MRRRPNNKRPSTTTAYHGAPFKSASNIGYFTQNVLELTARFDASDGHHIQYLDFFYSLRDSPTHLSGIDQLVVYRSIKQTQHSPRFNKATVDNR